VIERAAKQGEGIRAIRAAAMVLQPCSMVRILVEVLRGDVMMLASDHQAKA
jgi:hypothetical protein